MGKGAIKDADFRMFVVVWNQQVQKQTTPDLHQQIAVWLEERWKKGDKRLLLMAFRSAGKSTLVGLFCAWLLYRNPDLRILILAADSMLAGKMVRNVKRVIERHPFTVGMKPSSADQWASDRFTVNRTLELRDPSMLAKGVTANLTGSRADVIICDDVEVPNTCDSVEKREDLRERLAELSYILTADGTQCYVGTPHDYFSIYADTPRKEINEEQVFLDEYQRLVIPLLNENGVCAWPQRYSNAKIEQIKRDTGPNKFNSQMMLKAVNVMDSRLDPELLKFYDGDLHYVPEIGGMFIGNQQMINASCWWDPSFGAAKSDSSVLATVFQDMGGNYYLHHLEYLTVDEDSDIDEAHQQCQKVARILKEYRIPAMAVESNGLGKFLPRILQNEVNRLGVGCSVREETSARNKAVRIIEAFDAPMAAGMLHVHENVRDTPFIREMREWQPGKNKSKDDGLDAVAGAIDMHPIRIERIQGSGHRYSWHKGAQIHSAKSEFDV